MPFASGNALFGLLKLSVWWLRLGINLQRVKPGHPEQNGRHERMPLTLKNEATKPAAFNFLQQQERFDQFIGVYINERPHQALGRAYPGDIYTPSARVYEPPGEPEYPYYDRSARVTRCGRTEERSDDRPKAHLHRQAQDQPPLRVRRPNHWHPSG